MSKGTSLAILAAIISGISIFINKFAVSAISPPLVFTSVKNSIVAFFILSLLFLSGKWRKFGQISFKQKILLFTIGIVGGSLPFYLFFTGLSSIPAVNGTLINKTMVLWVALLALPLLKEKLTKIHLLAVLLLFSSNLLIGGFSGFKYSQGELFVLFATLLWSVETILAKKLLPDVDPDLLTSSRMGLGSFILITTSLLSHPSSFTKISQLTSTQWMWLLLTASTLFFYVSIWFRALKQASAISVTAIMVGSTLITNILTVVFNSHSLSPQILIQSVVILIGLFLFTVKKPQGLAPSNIPAS